MLPVSCRDVQEMQQQHRRKKKINSVSGKERLAWGAVLCTYMSEAAGFMGSITGSSNHGDGQGSRSRSKCRQEKSSCKSSKMGPTLLMNICILAIVKSEAGRIALIICVCRNPSKFSQALRKTMCFTGAC